MNLALQSSCSRSAKTRNVQICTLPVDEHQNNDDDEPANPIQFDEDESDKLVSTKLYGQLNFRTAESLLNGGRSSISRKSRLSRFSGDAFGISSDIRLFNQPLCECTNSIKIGMIRKLESVKDSEKRFIGEVRFISYNGAPLKLYCAKHSLVNGQPKICGSLSTTNTRGAAYLSLKKV